MGAKFFYDDVHYNTEFSSVSSDNNVGAGGSLQINQVITNRMKVSGKAEIRAIYNTYGGTLSWAPEAGKMIGLRLSLFGGRLVSHNQTPDSNNIGLEIAFLSDESSTSPAYAMQNAPILPDLVDWVRTPAVYMDRVLAIAEQNTYLNAPMASSISPNTGPYIGGNTITINGTNFLPGVSVTFDNMPASTTLVSSTALSVIVPAFTPATQTLKASNTETTNIDVVIKNTNGQETVLSGGYTYTTANAPTLTNISPDSGSIEGNTTVTLTGAQLTGTTSVQFDNIDATNVNVINDTTVTAVTPAHAAGSVNVSLSTSGGVAELVGGYTYVAAPSVNSIEPSYGSTTGGTLVSIIGSNFTSATAVNFGDQSATSFNVISDTEISAVSPANSANTVDITVTNPTGTSSTSVADQFTYIGAPTITSISPSSGTIHGGTTVTIIGTGFTSVTGSSGITFGGTDASSYTIDSDTQITAITPAHIAGAVDVTVTTPAGSATATDAFTYTETS